MDQPHSKTATDRTEYHFMIMEGSPFLETLLLSSMANMRTSCWAEFCPSWLNFIFAVFCISTALSLLWNAFYWMLYCFRVRTEVSDSLCWIRQQTSAGQCWMMFPKRRKTILLVNHRKISERNLYDCLACLCYLLLPPGRSLCLSVKSYLVYWDFFPFNFAPEFLTDCEYSGIPNQHSSAFLVYAIELLI